MMEEGKRLKGKGSRGGGRKEDTSRDANALSGNRQVVTVADLDAAPVGSWVYAPSFGSYIKVAKPNSDCYWWCPPNDSSMPFPTEQLAFYTSLLLEPLSDAEFDAILEPVVVYFSPGECTTGILFNAPVGSTVNCGDFGMFIKRSDPDWHSWTSTGDRIGKAPLCIADRALSIAFPDSTQDLPPGSSVAGWLGGDPHAHKDE